MENGVQSQKETLGQSSGDKTENDSKIGILPTVQCFTFIHQSKCMMHKTEIPTCLKVEKNT